MYVSNAIENDSQEDAFSRLLTKHYALTIGCHPHLVPGIWETFVSRLIHSAVPSVPGRQNTVDGELPAHRRKRL